MQVRDATGQPHASGRPRPGCRREMEGCKGLDHAASPLLPGRQRRDAELHRAADSELLKPGDWQPPPQTPTHPPAHPAAHPIPRRGGQSLRRHGCDGLFPPERGAGPPDPSRARATDPAPAGSSFSSGPSAQSLGWFPAPRSALGWVGLPNQPRFCSCLLPCPDHRRLVPLIFTSSAEAAGVGRGDLSPAHQEPAHGGSSRGC